VTSTPQQLLSGKRKRVDDLVGVTDPALTIAVKALPWPGLGNSTFVLTEVPTLPLFGAERAPGANSVAPG